MKLRYRAISKDGKTIRGFIEAAELSEAADYLRKRELIPITITKETDKGFQIFSSRKKVKMKDLILFTRQISSMLSSGLTLLKSLEILKDQTENKVIRETIGAILLDLEEGTSFSTSIAKYPEIFPPIYVSLVKAGESSGLLDKVFLRLAMNLERQDKLRKTVKSALTYPVIILSLMLIVMGIMMIFVIPQLAKLYDSLNAPLPLTTKVVVGMSSLLGKTWPIVVGLGAMCIYAFKRWKKTPKGKEKYDRFLLRMPIFGKIIRESILAEFSRTFGLLVGTGTLVIESLNQSAEVAGNVVYEKVIRELAVRVEKGVTVGESMTYYKLFPPLLVQLVKSGEETGKLDENLLKASEYFEEEATQAVKSMTTAMEPFIMVVLGVGVGFLIFSVITPIYGIISTIQ